MNTLFSDRIADVPQSFIREILKVTLDDSIISFAGGLPNRDLFPVEELRQAADRVFTTAGRDALQYASSEGYLPLRQYIASRYRAKQGLDVPPENILITTGSQQGLDLLGKTFINSGDDVVIETPGYLGAIQAFSLYRPCFHEVTVTEEGMDCDALAAVLATASAKLLYTVPNFQNPAGISYSPTNRREVAECVASSQCTLIQDDPYGDLRFAGAPGENFLRLLPEQCILLGSFSKTIAPSLRIGWLVAPPSKMEKLLIAKQAADLHTDALAQRILCEYLRENDLDAHVQKIIRAYRSQKEVMVESIRQFFPSDVRYTNPDGGMFLWITLPEKMSSMTLFHQALKEKVAFVPGTPFYLNREDTNTLRLNFSCMDTETIRTGIRRLGKAIERLSR